MFTGIIQELGEVASLGRRGGSMRMEISCAKVLEGARPGDSIAVNGVCLTADDLRPGRVAMDVGEETFRRTTLGALRPGARVNLEPALRLGQPLGGHIVSGHVDATAAVRSVAPETTQTVVSFELPEALRPLVAPKGSIAIDGVSLTVGAVSAAAFSVYLIPHTVAHTTLLDRRPGDRVNLEADVLARYVHNSLAAMGHAGAKKPSLIDKLKQYEY